MPSSSPASDPAAETFSPTKSGITLTTDGQRVIPSSVRPDGSTRREIRVRPGYRPPEDVEVYKNRTAEAWKNRGSGGVPGASSLSDDDKKQPVGASAANKNAKRKAARKRAKEKEATGQPETDGRATESDEKINKSQKDDPPSTTPAAGDSKPEQANTEQTPDEKEKLAKAIRKKIRQANELKIRKEVGESLLPEQLEKVIKLQELTRQLSALGFDQ
ncbi:hypothetical protein L873DRAFT_1284800 [Choiromyces venosus 120613-1]|uniref:WIBG Mago-binding domain-containing protein n=1 Tax=Choiromyces venosus 120613-1 TaxID=1336337 RepID=A0A3N4JGS8_9PEZI|nr:hypothetical protein L873DRAFT_1284800 [Choiromyces venosus 120613-1]